MSGWLTAGVIAPLAVALVAMLSNRVGVSGRLSYDVAWTASALSATIGMLTARARSRPENRLRWTLWSLACASWLFGQMAWNVFGIIGFPPSPNLADAGWWGFGLLMIVSVLRLPRATNSVKLVAAVESVPLIVAAVSLCLAELWATAAQSALATAPKIAALTYSALYVTAAVLTLQAMLGGALRSLRTVSLRIILAGIACQAFAFILWSSQLLRGTYQPGVTLLDPLWVVGLGAIGIGGLLAARRPEPAAYELERPSHLGVVLPGAMYLLLFCAIVDSALFDPLPREAEQVLRIGLLCSGAALIARASLLGRRLKVMLDRERSARAQLAEREAELAQLNEQLTEDSRRDPLTGIGNRRALSDDLPMYETLQRERGSRIAVALCDVDHFKSYNDRLGHLAGDQALRMISATVRGALGADDAAYRFGGEELLLVMRDAEPAGALATVERVRTAVEHRGFAHPEGEHGLLTVSIGLAFGDEPVEELLAQADAALYEAKRSGRNRVVRAQAATRLPAPARQGPDDDENPVPRHLRGMLAVSRAAATGRGASPVLEALAEVIRAELSFQVVAVNLFNPETERLEVALVDGDAEARKTLLHTSWPFSDFQAMRAEGKIVHGAVWLEQGTYASEPAESTWIPPGSATVAADAWHSEDMLLLPMRGTGADVHGVVSVDQPHLGRRPSDAEIGILMAVVDHAGLVLDQVERERGITSNGSTELRLAAVMLLAETLDLRDPRTALHSRTVGRLARRTAVALGIEAAAVERIHAAGVLHDLGKLGIADAILQKPGPLDDVEWREMRRHPEVGARILENAGMEDIATWVRAHHERIDGNGYPAGLEGGRIPLEARILAVADAFEAMIADRPYRAGMPVEAARDELLRCSGSQFDPVVVDAFLRGLARAAETKDDRDDRGVRRDAFDALAVHGALEPAS